MTSFVERISGGGIATDGYSRAGLVGHRGVIRKFVQDCRRPPSPVDSSRVAGNASIASPARLESLRGVLVLYNNICLKRPGNYPRFWSNVVTLLASLVWASSDFVF